MPITYKCDKHAITNFGDSLTEQEHKDSCNINKMIKASMRGQNIRYSGREPIYGYDDTTLDGVSHRIQKQQLENELHELSQKAELSDEELQSIPQKIREKFGFKAKAKKQDPQQTTNQTTIQQDPQSQPQQQNQPKSDPVST